jgi:AcrR family transcriptional regulator
MRRAADVCFAVSRRDFAVPADEEHAKERRRTEPTMSGRSPIHALYDAYLRKQPKQSRSRTVVEAILTAAGDVINRSEDEEGLRVQDVAERAGVGIGSLYDYFGDRKSLMAGLAAKVTEENLRTFEEVLHRCEAVDLERSVALIVDHAFDTYTKSKKMPRAVLRIASKIGLMPTLADSQAEFARALAGMLRTRTDVRVKDVDATAYVVTNAVMGVVHTVIWSDTPPFSSEALRAATTAMCFDHLRD